MRHYLLKNNPAVIAYFLLAPLSAVCNLALSAGMAAAMDYASGGRLDDAWKYLIAFSGYILLDFAVDQTFQSIRFRALKKTALNLRADVYRHIAYMKKKQFAVQNSADYIAALTADIDLLRSSYYETLLRMYVDLLRFLFGTVYLFWLSPILGGFILAVAAIQTLVPILYAPRIETAGAAFSAAQEGHMAALKENLSAFLTAKVFHLERELEKRYCTALETAEESRRSMLALKTLAMNTSFLFSRVTQIGVYLLGAVLVLAGMISAAEIVAASEIAIYVSNPIYYLNTHLNELKSSKASAEKLMRLLGQSMDLGGTQAPKQKGRMDIRLQNVAFAYVDKPVLYSVSFCFEAGKKYLILGGSGSGKSTMLDLIAGLRGDHAGSITLGGTDLKELSRESLTRCLCYLDQEPYLLDDTLYENIALFSGISEDAVRTLLRQVGLGHFSSALHARIGEQASGLSGGEKQRLAIARALAAGADILLLDESTCHLDPETAASIEKLIMELPGKTVLLVSHNATAAAVSLADAVVEMTDGMLTVLAKR